MACGGTLVLTTVLRATSELHPTRMDLPFLLGTVITADRTRAKAASYAAHFAFGLVVALGYYALFAAISRHGWWLGTLFGLGQSLFASIFLVNVLLPLAHPRMGTPLSDAGTVSPLEPPRFMLRNYSLQTPAVSLVARVQYGTSSRPSSPGQL